MLTVQALNIYRVVCSIRLLALDEVLGTEVLGSIIRIRLCLWLSVPYSKIITKPFPSVSKTASQTACPSRHRPIDGVTCLQISGCAGFACLSLRTLSISPCISFSKS